MSQNAKLNDDDKEGRMKSLSDVKHSNLQSNDVASSSSIRHEADKAEQNTCERNCESFERNIDNENNFEGDIELNETKSEEKLDKSESEEVIFLRNIKSDITNYDGKIFKISKGGNHEEISSGCKILHFVGFTSFIEVVSVIEKLCFDKLTNLLVVVVEIKLPPSVRNEDQNCIKCCKILNNLLHKFKKFDDLVIELNIQDCLNNNSLIVASTSNEKISDESHLNAPQAINEESQKDDENLKFLYVKSQEILNSTGSFICISEIPTDCVSCIDEIDLKPSQSGQEAVVKHKISNNDDILNDFDDEFLNLDKDELASSEGGSHQNTDSQFNLNLFLIALVSSKISFLDHDLTELRSTQDLSDFSIKNLLKSLIKANNPFTIALMNLFNLQLTTIDVIELLAHTILSDNKKIPKAIFDLHYTKGTCSITPDGALVSTPQFCNTLTKKRESRRSISRDSFDGFKIDLFVKQTFPKVNISDKNVRQLKILMESLDRESDREKCLTFIAEQNNFKFLKIFLKFFNKLKYELWLKIIRIARNLEFFGIVRELLDEDLTSDYKRDHERIAIDGLRAVLNDVELFFECILNRNIPKIKSFIKLHPTMKKIYLKDISALEFSLECMHFEIFAYLKIKCLQGDNIQLKISKLSKRDKRDIRDNMLTSVKNYKDTYILTILTKCRYASSISCVVSDTKEMLSILKEIREIKPMLRIISKVDIEIFFDFHNESVSGIDPTVDEGTRGLTYFIKNQILIGKDSGKNARYVSYFLTNCRIKKYRG